MTKHLHLWFLRWLKAHEDTELIYANGAKRQIMFVRDTLAPMVWGDIKYDDRATFPDPDEPDKPEKYWDKVGATVVGEHTSKSVPLPVYDLSRPDLGLRFVLRDNFHDWNISVVSETPIDAKSLLGFPIDFHNDEERAEWTPGRYWGYLFYQGFPDDLRYGPLRSDPRKFSTWCASSYQVYALLFTILNSRRSL